MIYKYIDSDGKQQEVTVQWIPGECKKKQFIRGGRRTSITYIWEATSYIQLSKPLPATLSVNTTKREAIALKNLTQETKVTPVIINVPRGTVKHPVTHQCRLDYIESDPTRKFSIIGYKIEEQANVPDEPEIFEPLRQEDLKFNETPDWFSVFTEAQPTLNDIAWRVEIRKRVNVSAINTNNTGVKEICLGGTPVDFQERARKKGDEYEPLVPSALTINMIAFEEGELEDVGTAGDAELRVDVFKGNDLFFQGYNLASEYAEAYKAPPYTVSIDFGCGLALLQRIAFEIDEENSRKPALDIIRKCLGRLNSELGIMSAVYTYPAEMPRNLNTDPFAVCEYDERVYQDSKGVYSCGRVLEEILRGPLAQMFLSHHLGSCFWFIREINSTIDDLPYRYYYKDQPAIKRLPASKLVIQRDGDGQPYQINADSSERKKKETYREVIVNRKLDYITQLFPGGEFDSDSKVGRNEIKEWEVFGEPEIQLGQHGGREIKTGRGGIGIVGGNYSIKLKGRTGLGVIFPKNGVENTVPIDHGYRSTPVKVHVENGNTFSIYMQLRWVTESQEAIDLITGNPDSMFRNMMLPIQVKIGDKYLNEDKSWTTAEHTMYISSNIYGQWFTYAFEDIPVVSDDNLQIAIVAPLWPLVKSGMVLGLNDLLQAYPMYAEIDFIRGQYLPKGDFATTSNTIYATNVLSRSNSEPYELTVIHADVDTLQNISAITYEGNLTTTWQRYYADGEALPLGELTAKKILDNHTNTDSWRLNNFSVIENGSGLSFSSVVTTAEMPDKRFICTSWRYTPVTPGGCGIMTCDWIEINNANVVPRFEYDRGEGTYGSAGGGGYGGGNPVLPTQEPFDILKYLTPQDITNPYFVGMKDGKFAIDLKELSEEFEPETLDITTKQGNVSERDILIGPLTATNNERVAYTRSGVYAQSNKLELSSNTAIRFLGPALVAEIKNSDFYHYDVNATSFTASKLIAKDTNGKTRGIAPSEIIKTDANLGWNGNQLIFKATIPEAFDKDYNSLKNRPITNYSSYGQTTNYMRLGYIRQEGYSFLLGVNGVNEIIKGTPYAWKIATHDYVNSRGYATETWVKNYVGSQVGADTNYYAYATALEADGRLRIDVKGYGSIRTSTFDNRYLKKSDYNPGGSDGNSWVNKISNFNGQIYVTQTDGGPTVFSDFDFDNRYLKLSDYNGGGTTSGASNTYFRFNSGKPYIEQSPGVNVYLDTNLFDHFQKKGSGLGVSVGKMGAGTLKDIVGVSWTTFHTVNFPAGYITGHFIVECYRDSKNTSTLIDVSVNTSNTASYSLFSFDGDLSSVYSQRTTIPFILNSTDSRTVTAQFRMWLGHNGITQQIKVLGIHYMKLA